MDKVLYQHIVTGKEHLYTIPNEIDKAFKSLKLKETTFSITGVAFMKGSFPVIDAGTLHSWISKSCARNKLVFKALQVSLDNTHSKDSILIRITE